MNADHDRFMALAIEEAKRPLEEGNSPVGSVVVKAAATSHRTRSGLSNSAFGTWFAL